MGNVLGQAKLLGFTPVTKLRSSQRRGSHTSGGLPRLGVPVFSGEAAVVEVESGVDGGGRLRPGGMMWGGEWWGGLSRG